jgi:GNAT superfamily N-acetyltransferase
MADEELFTLRSAREGDYPSIEGMAAAEGMEGIPSVDNVTVAVNAADEVVGFIRLEFDAGAWHVNPVVTYPTWRGHGVGRALVEDAAARVGDLVLVARGYSVPFYEKLGFANTGWDSIGPIVSTECDTCPIREECAPQPMRRAAEARGSAASNPDRGQADFEQGRACGSGCGAGAR